MNQCCPSKSICIDPSNPVQNFSAEAPDLEVFISQNTGWDQGIGGYNTPPVGGNWNSDGCQSTCTSTISQADADLCAANLNLSCSIDTGNWTDPNNNRKLPDLCNDSVNCASLCPDGIPFNFTIPAGSICTTNKAYSNHVAGSLACNNAAQRKICLAGPTPNESCINPNTPFGCQITASGGLLSGFANTWVLVSGLLPDGMNFSGGFGVGPFQKVVTGRVLTITGVPTAAGNFVFTIRVTAPNGDFMQKQFSICIIDINQSALPDATIGVPYTTQLAATFCAGTQQSWQVLSANLPAGLSLNEQTGVISGTPTGPAGAVTLKVQFQDAAT